ncbi:hypothetical protein [Paenibacillus arenilitoris]|uniref:Uncharacterized protein n=1 Tax=Paenibacillus arenilitoris TaxID=2772299 RepID=A0A927CQ73_9BACL|nr:hypothetical protein [Paenibacillus arenilitoris]MBD2870788.1 hypothetical protein [Paenibacillus arenilitoris]
MNIDRQKLVEHLQKKDTELSQSIDVHGGVDEDIVLMRFAKRIILTQLLNDLDNGKFDIETN